MANQDQHSNGPPISEQKDNELQQMISQTIALLSPAGYSDKSIDDYTRSGFGRLMQYFNLHETGFYDEALLYNFINETRAAYDQKLITRYFYCDRTRYLRNRDTAGLVWIWWETSGEVREIGGIAAGKFDIRNSFSTILSPKGEFF